MSRPVYVYRLDVTYPEGVDWRNPPKAWLEERAEEGPLDDGRERYFAWPTRRHYMSREGAMNRADLLAEWGCIVTIERSNPVTWGET